MGFLHYHTARPGPARPGPAQARPGPSSQRKGTIRLGPARPGTGRHRPTQARPDNGMVAPRLGCTHTPCFTPPTQRTCRTNTASPQVGPGSTRPAGRTASTRPGPAQALYVDSDKSRLSWVTPIRSAPIDLVSGDKGYSYKWVAHLTMWQEPPSPSWLLATARPRPGPARPALHPSTARPALLGLTRTGSASQHNAPGPPKPGPGYALSTLSPGTQGGVRRTTSTEDPRGPMGGPSDLQEPPSPSRLLATARPRSGYRI